MIQFRPIDKYSKDKFKIKEIFIEAFPKEERPPYFFLQRKAKKSTVDFDGIYDGDKLVGLTYVVKDDVVAYLFFLAIKNEERGHGYGSQVMEALKERYNGKKLFLAREQLDPDASNYEQRLSRHRFYKKCGFQDMPYRLKEASVIFDVMGVGGRVEPDEYKKIMDDYLGPFVRLFVDMRFIEKI